MVQPEALHCAAVKPLIVQVMTHSVSLHYAYFFTRVTIITLYYIDSVHDLHTGLKVLMSKNLLHRQTDTLKCH